MKPPEDIENLIKNVNIETNAASDKAVLGDTLAALEKSNKTEPAPPQPHIWRITMKNGITKLAAAAAIVIVGIWLLSVVGGPDFESVTWADIREAFAGVESVHAVAFQIGPDGTEIITGEFWAKRPSLLRMDGQDSLDEKMSIIDNGTERVTINRGLKTVQFSEAKPNNEAYFILNWIGFLKGDEYLDESLPRIPADLDGHVFEPIPEESTSESIVYEVNVPGLGIDKIWVNRTTGLLEKQLQSEVRSSGGGGVTRIKKGRAYGGYMFDYETIPDEMFSLTIPEGFTEWCVPISGTVLNEDGSPAIGATVCVGITPYTDSNRTVSDAEGNWWLKVPAKTTVFPVGIWVTKSEDPNWAAWTVIMDPNDERELGGPIPGQVEEIDVLDENGFNRFAGARGIILQMEPADVMTGTVTDQEGLPLANVDISAVLWKLKDKKGHPLSTSLLFPKAPHVTTDAQGRYLLGNLPGLWAKSRITIRINKSGYGHKSFIFEPSEQIATREVNFKLKQEVIAPTVTVTGRVRNDLGEPLVGYLVCAGVGHDETKTDRQGEFTLECAGIEDQSLTLHGNRKLSSWDREYGDDMEFVYYPCKTQSIQYEPGKKEYDVEIVVEKPAIVLDFEVKDTSNQPIQKASVLLNHSDISAWWNENFKLVLDRPTTDANGRCTLRNFPRVDKPSLVVYTLNQPYKTLNKPITLSGDSKRYHIEVSLPKLNESTEPTVTVRPVGK